MKRTSCFSMSSLVVGCILLPAKLQHSALAVDPLVTTPTVRVVFVSSTHHDATTSNAEAATHGLTYLRFDIEGAGWGPHAVPLGTETTKGLVSYTYDSVKSNCTGWPCGGGGSVWCGTVWCPRGMCLGDGCGVAKTTHSASHQLPENTATLYGTFVVLHDQDWVFEGKNAIHGTTESGAFVAALVDQEPVEDTQHFQYLGSAFLTLSGCDGPLMGGMFDLDKVAFRLSDGTLVEPHVDPAEVAVTCVSPGRPVLFQVFNPCGSGVTSALAFSVIGLVQLRWLRWGQARSIPR